MARVGNLWRNVAYRCIERISWRMATAYQWRMAQHQQSIVAGIRRVAKRNIWRRNGVINIINAAWRSGMAAPSAPA